MNIRSTMNRRRLLQSSLVAGAVMARPVLPVTHAAPSGSSLEGQGRAAWIEMLLKISEPVLANLAANQLKQKMPVEAQKDQEAKRAAATHLEALGRTLAGLAPQEYGCKFSQESDVWKLYVLAVGNVSIIIKQRIVNKREMDIVSNQQKKKMHPHKFTLWVAIGSLRDDVCRVNECIHCKKSSGKLVTGSIT